MLAEPAGLLSSYQAHWLQVYTIIGAFIVLLGLSLVLIHNTIIDGSVHQLLRYLYLLVIIVSAYVLDQRIAIWLALFCTGIYVPLLIQDLYTRGWSPATIELSALLLSYNIFAIFTSTMTAFGRDHRRLSSVIEEFESVFEQAFNLEKLPAWILENSVHLTNATAGELYLAQTEEMEQHLLQTPTLDAAQLDSLVHWFMQQEQIVNLSHIGHDPRLVLPNTWHNLNGNLLAVPLGTPAAQTGLLVLWRHANQFRRREEELLQLLVARGYLVVENARLHARTDEALTQRANELAILLDASNTFATTLELDRLLEIFCNKLIQITQAIGCQIYLYDPDTASLARRLSCIRSVVEVGEKNEEIFQAGQLPFHDRVLQEGVPVVVNAAAGTGKMPHHEHKIVFQDGIRSALFLPLIFQDHQFGVAVLAKDTPQDEFSQEKVHLSEAIVREAVVALSNVWAFNSLKEAHRRIQLLIDNVAEGVFSIDTNRFITDFNPAAETLTGRSAAEAKALSVHELLICEEQHCLLCRRDLSLQEAVHSHGLEAPSHCRAWIVRQDGGRRAVSHSVAPLMTSDQQVSGAVSVVRDISREEELVRMKSDFISLVSHQLRTPLTNISMAAEMLSDGDVHANGQILKTLRLQSVRLRRLVDQVLMASRLERGQYQKTTLEPLALHPLLEETIGIFRAQHPELAFSLSVPHGPVFVLGDRVLLDVVLENLIQNAIDHAVGVSRIEVSVQRQEEGISISVADDGSGIPSEAVEGMFAPFHSGNDVNKHRRGFGLGLYLTRMSVEAQGGRIWVDRDYSPGTRFCFILSQFQGDE